MDPHDLEQKSSGNMICKTKASENAFFGFGFEKDGLDTPLIFNYIDALPSEDGKVVIK